MQTEVHVYGFAIAANVLLSFFPFLIVMMSFCRHVLHWPEAVEAIIIALRDYFPAEMGAFIERNLRYTVSSRGPMQIGSILLLFLTANGVFEPLEVALNRAWGIHENRSFLKNQLVSMGLIFLCGGCLALHRVYGGQPSCARAVFWRLSRVVSAWTRLRNTCCVIQTSVLNCRLDASWAF